MDENCRHPLGWTSRAHSRSTPLVAYYSHIQHFHHNKRRTLKHSITPCHLPQEPVSLSAWVKRGHSAIHSITHRRTVIQISETVPKESITGDPNGFTKK